MTKDTARGILVFLVLVVLVFLAFRDTTFCVSLDNGGRVLSIEADFFATDGEFREWPGSETYCGSADDAKEAVEIARERFGERNGKGSPK